MGEEHAPCSDDSFYLSSNAVNMMHAGLFGITMTALMFSFYGSDYVPPRVTKVKSAIYKKKSD